MTGGPDLERHRRKSTVADLRANGRLAIATAVVVVVAVLGIELALGSLPGFGVSSPTESPTSTPTPTPIAIEEYVAQVHAICKAADDRFRVGPYDDPEQYAEAAVRSADAALGELRALTPPEVIRPELDEVFVLLKAPIDVLRFVRWAASHAAPGVSGQLLEERVAVTHWRDMRLGELDLNWVERSGPEAGVLAPVFQLCPLGLGA